MYNPKRLIEPDEYFPRINEHMQAILEEWLNNHQSEEDIKLYHYTTARGIEGIISKREIWSTDIESMNDTKEIKYGVEVIEEEIKSAKERYEGDRLVSEVFLSSIEKELENLARDRYSIFVTCFCREGDLLSQWRGYADRGGGYSIEFKFNDSTTMVDINGNLKKPNLRRVLYDREEQKRIAGTLINAICEICSTFPSLERDNPDKEDLWSSVASYVSKTLIDFAVSFKHEGFKEEKEWRLVRAIKREEVNENVVNFRINGGLVVPYVTTELIETSNNGANIFPVTGAVWGPSHDDNRARRSLELFVESVANKDPIIDIKSFKSQSPEVPFEPPST